MYTFFIGGIIFVALAPLLKGSGRNVANFHDQTSWTDAKRIDHHIQQAKDKALGIYPWLRW